MPNRIIKDTIRTSDHIASLTDFEFRLWVGLIVSADDFGRGDARPKVLKGLVFPLVDEITPKTIANGLAGLRKKGSILLYEVDGRQYFCFPRWEEHQRVRNKVQKFPAPPTDCGELPQIAASCGEMLLESNPIQSNPNPNPNTESNARASDFDRFWSVYPKKVGKEEARKAFRKVKVKVDVLIEAVEKQKTWTQWQVEKGRFIPNPATWLNQGRWEDEGQAEKKAEMKSDTKRLELMLERMKEAT